MWALLQRWLHAIHYDDPIERRLALLMQGFLIGIVAIVIAGVGAWVVSSGSGYDSMTLLSATGMVSTSSLVALAMLRRGQLRTAILLASAGLQIALAIDYNGIGIRYGSSLLIGFTLPVALVGLLAGRRRLLVMIGLSYLAVSITGTLAYIAPEATGYSTPGGLPISASITAFVMTIALLGLLIDRYSTALWTAIDETRTRERELQLIRCSLELRTAELSQAKEVLENELAVRKATETALAYERDLLHALMDSLPDTIYFKDTQSRFLRINQAQAELLGIAASGVAEGKTDFDFQPIELARQFFTEEQQIFATGTPVLDRLEFNPTADGRPRWFSASKAPIKNQHGAIIGLVGLSRDITARHEIDRLKSEFIATVSHELRTPLTSIRGALGLLAGGAVGNLPPSAHSLVHVAANNSERLTRLINDLLDIEKIEAGKLLFQIAPIDLTTLVEQAIEANHAYGAHFSVTFRLAEALPGTLVNSDADRLMQVFTNLLSNAAKFSHPHGTVEIAITRQSQYLRITVTDHGVGIPEHFRDRVFGKFAQADSSDTRQKGGTGLGLSISKALVERLGGSIGFVEQADGGTSFFVDLPEWDGKAAPNAHNAYAYSAER